MKTKPFVAVSPKLISGALKKIVSHKVLSGVLLIIIILMVTLVFVSINTKLQIKSIVTSYIDSLPYYLNSLFVEQDTIHIDMKHIDVQKIDFMRQRALLSDKEFDYVPAVIRNENKTIKVKMRLKGDREIHYDNLDTSSYRVKIKGDETLFGMKTFSIHKPRSRNHLYEWVYLRLMQYAGVMAPQYKYVKLNFNGKDMGMYVIEEHYDKYLIERHNKREGPIVRFKEATVNKNYKFISKYHERPVVPYVEKKWGREKNLPITKKAVYLLEGYRRGDLTVSQVFDIEKLAMFFALTDLTGTHHGTVPKSLRFYYNPITSKLEPIPFDGHFGALQQPMLTSEMGITPSSWIYVYWKEFYISFFNDPDKLDKDFIREYVKALKLVSTDAYLDDFFKEISDEFKQVMIAAYSDLPLKDNISSFGPELFKFDKKIYEIRKNYILDKLENPTILAHSLGQIGKQVVVEVNSFVRHFPLEIISLNCGKKILKPDSKSAYIVAVLPLTNWEIHKVYFNLDDDNSSVVETNHCKEITFRILGEDEYHNDEVYQWTSYDHDFVKDDIVRSKANYMDFDFIKTDEINKTIDISRGKHVISTNLIFPEGYTVTSGSGSTLVLNNHSMIYSRSPINFEGTKEKPVVVTTGDNTGQGLAVIGAKNESQLKYVEFTNLMNPNQHGWSIPGSITFYESPVNMSFVKASKNKSEDAINIVRSVFEIQGLEISDSYADGLDVDFSKGRVIDSVFNNVGNDGIDVSGTNIELINIEVNKSGDKGISAGEESIVIAHDIVLNENLLSVASKDNSIVDISNLTVSSSVIAIAAYQKKPEFGVAKVRINGFNYDGEGVESLIEVGSSLNIDGMLSTGEISKVEDWIMNISKSITR